MYFLCPWLLILTNLALPPYALFAHHCRAASGTSIFRWEKYARMVSLASATQPALQENQELDCASTLLYFKPGVMPESLLQDLAGNKSN